MKRILAILMLTVLSLALLAPGVAASGASATDGAASVIYYDDGSYAVVTVAASPVVTYANTYQVTGWKTFDLYNDKNELQWTYKLIGTFRVVEGESVTCISSTYESTIYDSHWSLTDHSNSYSGNMAYGTATYKRKVLFVTTNTQDIDLALGCDRYGNIG